MPYSVDVLWQQITAFAADNKIVTSAIIIVLFLGLQRLVLKLIRLRSRRRGEDRRHTINILEQISNGFLVILVILVWSSEIQSLAISIAAFMVAIVIAMREFIQCFLGFIYYLGAKPFRVGDWVQMNKIVGEVVEMDWAKTALLEVDEETHDYTGKHVYVPNSHLVTQVVKNLNFLRRYKLHTFTITGEPKLNPYTLLPSFIARAKAHCDFYRDVAERYKSLIERHMEVEFIQIDPTIGVQTNELGHIVISVALFCPTDEAHDLQQKISADWMNLWHRALAEQEAEAKPATH